ncbi:helicase [Bifidobacterium ramosum]|uniref:Helicase n=1 Tax=Bifidobacterium ramosum TaxID=1798158 RepID=A0A6L4X3L0_9BIFI|nr:helicase [Bifidobacterium ramosum]KAB8289316.1 helicase [Bifidobacterium ramosum]NEG71020.1 helicase [Bifidobacterium ramosum]
MAEEANTTEQPQDTAEPHGETKPTDWEAKYREAVSHSREWEKRAKDNKAAADELQQLKESQMSEAQKAEARTAKLQKELDTLKAEKQTSAWRSQVAEESGLPANLIVGDSLEAMQAHAKAINEYIAERTRPVVHAAPSKPLPDGGGSSGDWLRDSILQNK